MDVALFATCLADTFLPRSVMATALVLEHFGCTVTVPRGQACCGQPAFNNGYSSEAREMVRRLVDVLDVAAGPAGSIVCPSGSCTAMLLEHGPELLADDPAAAARLRSLSGRWYEFGTFLTEVLAVDLAALNWPGTGPVTCHYGCHMRTIAPAAAVTEKARRLAGSAYRPLPEVEACCGFGGSFGAMYPELSQAMARDKLDAIASTDARTVVCNEAGCALTLEGAARRAPGATPRFRHLAELVAEALGLLEPTL